MAPTSAPEAQATSGIRAGAFEAYQAARFNIDSGDTAWMLTSCALVLLSASRASQSAERCCCDLRCLLCEPRSRSQPGCPLRHWRLVSGDC